ncbi:zeatin O-glucosyltransferase-like [Nicotiana tabacum]|uniref:Zeatin O-glucosyltransferase-like n=1 Tax=Nicotiana tabacum TaxID=4097 RepID=A0AC58TEC3_TOBAC
MASNIASLANHSQNCTKDQDVLIVMVPFPAQGHLNQLLHLSRLVSSYHLPVHYVSFSTSIRQAKFRVHGWDPITNTTPNIHFKEFPIPSTHVQSPNCSNMSKFIASTLDLSLTLREPISAFLNELSSTTRRMVIIYDSLMAWVVQDVVSIPNVEAYCFRAVSAFTTSSILWEGEGEEVNIPNGYEERIEGRGIVIKDWAPQFEILAHSSTGGFLSHCGWNSCMESITMGVPIATWPMSFDQPRNAVLVTNVLKIGIVVKDWEHCEDLVTSTKIENAVRKLMASQGGDEMRKRAMEFGKKVRESMMDGGVSRMEMDSFISYVTRH